MLCGGEPLGGNNYLYPVTFVADVTDGMRLVGALAGLAQVAAFLFLVGFVIAMVAWLARAT